MSEDKLDEFLSKLGNTERTHLDDGGLPVCVSTENKHLVCSSDAQENTEVHSQKSFQSESLEKDEKNRKEGSFDALEKCMEWLSHHPTDRFKSGQGQGRGIMQDVTKKNLLEYRQHAVLNWIATLPDSSSSSDSEKVKGLSQESRRREEDSDPTGMTSGLNLTRRTSLTQLVQSEGSEDESNWLSNIPILGRCCELFRRGMSKIYFREASQSRREGLTKEEEVIKQQLIALTAENFVDSGAVSQSIPLEELSSGEARPRTGQDRKELRPADNVYFEEIQRLTNLLSNTPKPSSKMRTIFSLRKERILPEAPAPPGFINRVGRHVQGFFQGRFGRKRNGTNRVNPSHGSDRATGQTVTESTATRSAFSTVKNFFFKPTAAQTSTLNNED